MSAIDDTYDRLKKVNEPKGYFFNADDELVTQLIQGLLTNKERYGYCAARAAWPAGRARPTETSSARATTGSPTSRSTAPATALYT